MSKPIPDEVLQAYTSWGEVRVQDLDTWLDLSDPEILQSLLITTRLAGRDLARELLACRKVLRTARSLMFAAGFGRKDPRDCLSLIDALLPEHDRPL